ncbi:MAG TPA: C4-type zinc ribbon domain-containing protein [Syntrophorhabdaceae bacterium]|nr:C4-type zinc ribbon domain-containing protein [Syntrophorhabdaceae bacterium]
MEQELNTIYEAQKIDLKILEKERVLLSTPNTIKGMENELEAARMKVQKEKEVIEELEKERKKKEKELESDKDKVKKLESKLYEVKTNKEYQALLKEIEAAKATNDKTEEDILVLMDKAEEIKKDHDSTLVHLQKREKEVQTEKGKIEKDIESIDQVISQLKTERDNLLSVVNEHLRSTYLVLRDKRNGVAVSTAKNGVCLGCFMNIPPQLFIEVTKNRQLIQCPSCGRILYFLVNE